MLSYWREKWKSWELKAQQERVLAEQVLELVERKTLQPVMEEGGGWLPVGQTSTSGWPGSRADLLKVIRKAVMVNPHAKNILRMFEVYVAGPGLKLAHAARMSSCQEREDDEALAREADRLWKEFLAVNHAHFSYREFGRRMWRDGEAFVRKFSQASWPVHVRFVDPEAIRETAAYPGTEGVLNDRFDVESVWGYVVVDADEQDALVVSCDEMLHAKYGVDSNQRRGVSLLASIIDNIQQFESWMEIELAARKLQTSIVLWRKISGSPGQVTSQVEEMSSAGHAATRREQYRPGSIITTSSGTEMKFLQPDTNFGDAVPLGRMLLLSTSAGVGLPEFMVTSDASNSNYSSTMVSEGPAVKVFEAEQEQLLGELERLWRWVMNDAVMMGLLPEDMFERLEPSWSKPKLVVKDRPREREADVKLVESKILSKAEVARREGVEPGRMRGEIEGEG
ncbi:phage portal protein [Lacunimicrobium album]